MGTTREDRPACTGIGARDLLPARTFGELQRLFRPRDVEYIAHVLTAGELAVLRGLEDALIIARIKRMRGPRLDRFDGYVPIDAAQQRFYHALQMQWLRDEQYLLSTRLGRAPTHEELFIDFMKNCNGQRFRAYFAMKYPDRVRRVKAAAAAAK